MNQCIKKFYTILYIINAAIKLTDIDAEIETVPEIPSASSP